MEGKSITDEPQAWVDEHIMPKAVETAARLQTDKALYGFAAINTRGERIDPAKLRRHTPTPDCCCSDCIAYDESSAL